MSAAQPNTQNLQLGSAASGILMASLGVGAISLVGAFIVAAMTEHGWEHFFRSYLFAFMVVLAICLGALFFTMLQHAVRAGWSVVLRRIAENVAANLQWIWILFIPVALSLWVLDHGMYHWLHPAGDHLLEHKIPWFFGISPLNEAGEQVSSIPWFWLARAAFCLLIWAVLSRFYYRTSVRQDATGDVNLTHKMQRWAPLGLLLYALTQSIAAIDWMESLEAHWFSTMFAVYFFAASCCGYFAVQILLMKLLQRFGKVTKEITREHYQDAGKLLFAFGVVFWAYIAYSQFMLIWYANIPEETTWYMTRQLGGWWYVSMFLLFGHFVIPFLFLVTKHTKRATAILAAIAIGMIVMHITDIYWLIMPVTPNAAIAEAETVNGLMEAVKSGAVDVNFHPQLMDVLLVVGMCGLLLGLTLKRMGAAALIPQRDPRLNESLAFENF